MVNAHNTQGSPVIPRFVRQLPSQIICKHPLTAYQPGDPESYRSLVAWRADKLKTCSVPANQIRILFLNCLYGLDTDFFLELWTEIAGILGVPALTLIEDLYFRKPVKIGLHDSQIICEIFEDFLQRPAGEVFAKHLMDRPVGPWLDSNGPLPGSQGQKPKWSEWFFDERMDPGEAPIHMLMEGFGMLGHPSAIAKARRVSGEHPEILMQIASAPGPDMRAPIWYDSLLYDSRIIAGFSARFGLPGAREYLIRFDCRPLEYALRNFPWRIDGDGVYLGGTKIGIIADFLPAWKQIRWEIDGFPAPEMKVVQATQDWHCASTGRILWQKGTLYGTPFFMAELKLPAMPPAEKAGFREKLLGGRFPPSPDPAWETERRLLDRRLQAVRNRLHGREDRFSFNRESDHLYLGTERFARGPVARILVHMLRNHAQSGRTEFPNIAMKYDSSIIDNPKATSFETYLKRLQAKLADRSANVRLDLSKRGLARLELTGPFEIRET